MSISTGQFVAFSSSGDRALMCDADNQFMVANPVVKRQLGDDVTGPADSRFQKDLPVDVIKQIFLEASKVVTDPRHLRTVNSHWAHSMRYVVPESEPATADIAGILYTNPNNDNFMEGCLRLYMDGMGMADD